MEKMDNLNLALVTVRDYVCEQCWGELTYWPVDGQYEVYCKKDPEHQWFVTKHYAEKQRSASRSEAREVERMLVQVGILPAPPKRPEAMILKELGF